MAEGRTKRNRNRRPMEEGQGSGKKELQEVATSDPPIHNFKPLAGAHPIMIQ